MSKQTTREMEKNMRTNSLACFESMEQNIFDRQRSSASIRNREESLQDDWQASVCLLSQTVPSDELYN